jgi:Glyoxalase-like domain
MRLDHVSYVASHEQLSDTVQRIGSMIGTTFVDGGIHPRFGTRNFTAPLLNNQYVEVVCALDHPAAEQTPFGQAVSKKAAEGGGWLTWVFSIDDLAPIEAEIGRPAIEGHRRRPDGTDLKWKQVGVKELLTDPDLPFFIQWQDGHHPSQVGIPTSSILEITFANSDPLSRSAFKSEVIKALALTGTKVTVAKNEEETGLIAITFKTKLGTTQIS